MNRPNIFLSATAGGAESHPIQDLSTNSSLRRKLFDGDQMEEDEDEDDEEEDDLKKRLSSPIPGMATRPISVSFRIWQVFYCQAKENDAVSAR